MESAINVSVDRGCLRLTGEIPVASSKEDLEVFVLDIKQKLLGDRKIPRLPSFGLAKRELTEAEAAIYIGRSKSFLRKCRADGNAGGRQRGPKYTRASERTIRYPVDELDKWLSSRAKYGANCEIAPGE
jgi:hypothetical protein